jgi:hypothetical protein
MTGIYDCRAATRRPDFVDRSASSLAGFVIIMQHPLVPQRPNHSARHRQFFGPWSRGADGPMRIVHKTTVQLPVTADPECGHGRTRSQLLVLAIRHVPTAPFWFGQIVVLGPSAKVLFALSQNEDGTTTPSVEPFASYKKGRLGQCVVSLRVDFGTVIY